jgi:tripartite-type tricarboxylate transporter receptor subunit TctC
MKRRSILLMAAMVGLGALSGTASAQAKYPSKPIRIIVPFPAGSGTDASARYVAQHMSEILGQPVVVDNRAGGNGFIAAQAVAQSPADGYTIFVTTMTTQSVNPHLYKKLPYDPFKDFTPVAMITKSPMVLVVRNTPGEPKSLAEMTAKAKKGSAKMTYASGNTSSRVSAEMYANQSGIKLLQVPYKGTPQALTDLIGGQVDLMFPDLTPAVPLVKDGKLRALAVTGTRRVPVLPDVPTMAEAGVPVDLVAWAGALVPAGTPPQIVNQLSEVMQKVLSTQQAKEFFARYGGEPTPSSAAEMEQFLKKELDNWGRAIRVAGIEPE